MGWLTYIFSSAITVILIGINCEHMLTMSRILFNKVTEKDLKNGHFEKSISKMEKKLKVQKNPVSLDLFFPIFIIHQPGFEPGFERWQRPVMTATLLM